MNLTRNLQVVLLGVTMSMACAASETDDPVTKIASATPHWELVLRHYQELGEHRSGTESDHATAQWLLSELENRGVNGKLQAWPLRVFHLRKSELKTQSDSFDNFPFWYPQATGPHGIQAPLTLLGSGGEDAMDGTIALIRVPPSQYEFHFNVAPELQRAADQGARGAVVILNHPMKAVSAQNTNRQWNQQELPLPALIASEADAEALLTAASNRTEITLVINGQSRLGEAMNILGKVERKSDRWLVISTPVSGWFEVTNERGPGIALWLQLAEWLVDSKLETNVLFAALSGHELSGMGMQALIDSGELPEPDSVGLWLHLGSGIAVETPLLSAASSTIALEELVQQTLTAHTAMIYWPEDKMPKGSEQYLAAQLGYPVVGLFGADPAIHTRLDQSPRINEREYNSIFKALQTLIKRRLSSTNHPHQKTAQ